MPLTIVRNDITKMNVDAIVNAANESLLGGGGVDGCIHREAGPELLAECRTLGGCRTGDAKLTKGYRLPCRYVIHTVGPVWQGGGHDERELLSSCYRKSLHLALEHGCESVAFPLISAGAYGYPKDQALRVAVDTIGEFLMEHELAVYLVVFTRADVQIGGKLFFGIAEYINDNYVDDITSRNFWAHRSFSNFAPMERESDSNSAPREREGDFSVKYAMSAPSFVVREKNINVPEDLLFELDAGFSETLLKLIDQTGKKDSEVYKKANVDRKLFSKIRNNPAYKPSKSTALAFAIALELDLEGTKDLISKAGFALSRSSKFDVIIEYFIKEKKYDIFEINEALFAFDQSLLGA